jgi:hypothetical protein
MFPPLSILKILRLIPLRLLTRTMIRSWPPTELKYLILRESKSSENSTIIILLINSTDLLPTQQNLEDGLKNKMPQFTTAA